MNRSRRKPSRLESDAMRQCLMDPDQWARYLARVRELWRQGIPIAGGDSLAVLRSLPDGVARCCVTSPPYWGLRDYGVAGQLGLEPTPDAYVANMVAVFREVRRVLADDGTAWINLGDSYASKPAGSNGFDDGRANREERTSGGIPLGWKPKDLVGIPWRVAFALQADGWYLRSDIIWAKPNPMPESVTDRPSKAHEYVFLLSKRAKYYYDAAAIRTEAKYPDGPNSPQSIKSPYGQGFTKRADKQRGHPRRHDGFNDRWDQMSRDQQMALGSNARTIWSIATQPYPEAHFATFPEELARRCILAGSAPGDTVLDPFGGSGTVAQVATGNGRNAIHIDLNPAYVELARQRIGPMLCTAT